MKYQVTLIDLIVMIVIIGILLTMMYPLFEDKEKPIEAISFADRVETKNIKLNPVR